MRKVYDYKDLRKLEQTTIFQDIQKGVIITSTSDLAEEISYYYPTSSASMGIHVIDIHHVTKSLVAVWDDKVKDLRNYINLRNTIEDYIEENDLSAIHSAYLRRNAVDIWNAIVLLVEADVYPDDIPDNTSMPVKEFKYLWKRVETENSAFMQLRSSFLFDLSKREYLDNHLPKEVKGKQIFLLGFYYITPIQERLINALETAGYEISYLNQYDKAHPYFFEIWRNTFSNEYNSNSTIDIQPMLQVDNIFASCVENNGRDSEYNTKLVRINSYQTDIEFATACMNAKTAGASLYTTDSKKTDAILREFYPEEYEDKHLLSFPVGQYIYYLHMMWNEFIGEPELRYEYVFKCFASGWLEDDGINGQDYLYQLKILEPYFKNCNSKGKDSFAEWKKRANQLLEAKRITTVFGKESDSRWKNLLGNPFNNMAIYQLKDNEIEAIIQLLKRLMEDANELFSGNLTKDLYSHMQKIKKIIEAHADKDNATEDERIVMMELLNRLGGISSDGMICHLNGIKDAIILLIGDQYNNKETHEEETAKKRRLVKPLSMIEASTLSNYGQDIYLVMADEFLLPGNPRKLPWPLDEGLVDILISESKIKRKDTARYLSAMISLIKTRPLANRYLVYSLFDNITEKNKPVINISWISKQGEKNVAPSPYISLMGYTAEDIDKEKEQLWNNHIQRIIINGLTKESQEIKKIIPIPEDSAPPEVKGDYSLCRMRYFYAYILNYLPGFSSEFHYSFVLSNLVSAFSSISDMDKDSISEQLFELFPFLRRVEKKQASDYAFKYKSEDYEYEGVCYPGNRMDIHYLRPFIKESAESNAHELYETGNIQWKLNDEYCTYCPYNSICRVRFEGVAESES